MNSVWTLDGLPNGHGQLLGGGRVRRREGEHPDGSQHHHSADTVHSYLRLSLSALSKASSCAIYVGGHRHQCSVMMGLCQVSLRCYRRHALKMVV